MFFAAETQGRNKKKSAMRYRSERVVPGFESACCGIPVLIFPLFYSSIEIKLMYDALMMSYLVHFGVM